MSTMTLRFVKTKRDCPWNHEAAEKGQRIVYDFQVVRNGLLIGWFKPYGYKRGYFLCDMDGKGVEDPAKRTFVTKDIHADTQAEFSSIVDQFAHLLPTRAELDQRNGEQAALQEKAAADKLEAERLRKIEKAGPDLLAAIQAYLKEKDEYDRLDGPSGSRLSRVEACRRDLDAIINDLVGEHAQH